MISKVPTSLKDQIRLIENLSEPDLENLLPALRKEAMTETTPSIIKRWFHAKSSQLSDKLFAYLIDTRRQEELPFIIEAIQNEEYSNRRHELISFLWQSSLDSSDYLFELVDIALQGDFQTLIEVATVAESLEPSFNDAEIQECAMHIAELMDNETDDTRLKLLENLHQIVSELTMT